MTYSAIILADSPQVYYRLDEVSGTTAFDSSGNGNNGTYGGTTVFNQAGAIPGDSDTATLFRGANSTVTLPSTLTITTWTAISVEFWIKLSSGWQYVVVTCNNTTTILYLNGTVYSSGSGDFVGIGSLFDYAGSPASGDLDEIAIYNYVLTPTQITTHFGAASVQGTPLSTSSAVLLLINDVHYPTIRQESIQIDRTANDPVPTFSFRLQDDPSQIPLTELMEVVFLDGGKITNPTHNLLVNPLMNPYTSSWTTPALNTGATLSQNSGGGVTLTLVNTLTGDYSILLQTTQPGFCQAGQTYTFSAYVSGSSPVNAQAHLSLSFLDTTATVALATVQTVSIAPTSSVQRISLTAQAPTNAYYIQANLMVLISNATNSGTITFTSAQVEANAFTSGNYQLSYPTPDCNVSRPNCTVMPDGTTVRQFRLFGGYITKATAGNYVANNRQWQVTVSGYGWLLGRQILNTTWTNHTDQYIIGQIVSIYFPKAFSTAQVALGATLDTFGYQYNGTARDAFDALAANANYLLYIDAYRVIWYQPPGYNTLSFILSDRPDGITTFPYYDYSLDTDGTQLGNACLVQGATTISAIEYDAQSIGYYNQKTNGQGTFWRMVNDSTIATTTAARQRAIAENTQYNYARQIAHFSTNQFMIPGYSCLFTSTTDAIFEEPMLVQKATLVLLGFQSMTLPIYECQCDLGSFNPDLVNITVKMLRKQQVSTNSIGTPVIGLMMTENFTFIDSLLISVITPNGAHYGSGIYGTNTYAFSIPGVPTTLYGVGTYGDASKGYN